MLRLRVAPLAWFGATTTGAFSACTGPPRQMVSFAGGQGSGRARHPPRSLTATPCPRGLFQSVDFLDQSRPAVLSEVVVPLRPGRVHREGTGNGLVHQLQETGLERRPVLLLGSGRARLRGQLDVFGREVGGGQS